MHHPRTRTQLRRVRGDRPQQVREGHGHLHSRSGRPDHEEIETDEADAEIEILAKAETLEAYFGEETIAAVEEITENEFPCVCEFMSIRVEGYEEEMGDVKTNGKFASTFEQDAKVAALIGFTAEEGIEWNVFEAIGLEDGTIDMIIPGELLERVQDEGAFFSVIK